MTQVELELDELVADCAEAGGLDPSRFNRMMRLAHIEARRLDLTANEVLDEAFAAHMAGAR